MECSALLAAFDWYEGNRLTISPICYPNQPERLDVVLGKDGDENVLVYKRRMSGIARWVWTRRSPSECSSGKLWEDYCQGGARLTIAVPRRIQLNGESYAHPRLYLPLGRQCLEVRMSGCDVRHLAINSRQLLLLSAGESVTDIRLCSFTPQAGCLAGSFLLGVSFFCFERAARC